MNNMRFMQRKLGYIRRIQFMNKRSHSTAYEGDGKTTVTILNQQMDAGLMINSFSQVGFRLNNGLTVVGPMAIFPRTVVSWNVGGLEDVNENSLALFFSLDPKIDILVLGLGDEKVSPSFYTRILQKIRKHKMNVEILPTEQACATFNFLNGEGRCVGGALIPPANIRVTDNDMLQSKLRYQNLYIEE